MLRENITKVIKKEAKAPSDAPSGQELHKHGGWTLCTCSMLKTTSPQESLADSCAPSYRSKGSLQYISSLGELGDSRLLTEFDDFHSLSPTRDNSSSIVQMF